MNSRSATSSRSKARPESNTVVAAVERVLVGRKIHDQPVVAAVSGGADSVALLAALDQLRTNLRLELIVAHFDHRLRPDSGDDATWVERLGRSMGLDVRVGAPSTKPPATHIEEWARGERYAFLQQVANDAQARWIAVAHTASDQAETVLHHALRGSGLTGLSGIPQTRKLSDSVRLIRPCLSLERREMEAFLAKLGLEFRVDHSNEDQRLTRNALRHSLLPEIRRRFNPRADQALVRLAEQSREAVWFLRKTARQALKAGHLETASGEIRLSTRAFEGLDEIVVREVAVLIWTRLRWPRQKMTSGHWQRAAALLQGKGPVRGDWPGGVRGERRKGLVMLRREG